MLQVRRILAAEWEAYRDLRLRALADAPEAFSATHAEEAGRPDAFWQERTRGGATLDDRATFVAEIEGSWVGLVSCLLFEPAGLGARPAWVVSMWVDPGARKQGVGQALIGRLVDWARERDVDVLNLLVTEGNAPAIGLYERLGFHAHGPYRPHPHMAHLRDVHMVRALDESR
jgi:GNAT superfamily N-acetyltransferase